MRSLLCLGWMLIVGVSLAACDQSSLLTQAGPKQNKSLALVGGDVIAAAPSGYCIDNNASSPAMGFAVVAPCTALGETAESPAIVGLATIQVGAADSHAVEGAEPAMLSLLKTEPGAVLLSADGNAASIDILSSSTQKNRVIVHFADSSEPFATGLQSDEWRAFIDVGDRLVTVAIRGLSNSPISASAGAQLLNQVVSGLIAANEK